MTKQEIANVSIDFDIDDVLEFIEHCNDEEVEAILNEIRYKRGIKVSTFLSKPSLLDDMINELFNKARTIYTYQELETILKL